MSKRWAWMPGLAAVLIAACGKAPESPPAKSTPSGDGHALSVEGSTLILTQPDGRVLRGTELQGQVVSLPAAGGVARTVKIETVTPDPEFPDLLHYGFQVQQGFNWKPACEPTSEGERWGFPAALPEGHPSREGPITILCATQVAGKCARFGYRPWAKGPRGDDLAPLHAACVRMMRADYCGDGTQHTAGSVPITLYDDVGIRTTEGAKDPAWLFEAGWSAAGAVCVARTRAPDVLALDALLTSCPRLAAVPSCDEAAAKAAGARLFNRSKISSAPPG